MLGARASSPAPRAYHAKISAENRAGYCSHRALSADEDVRAPSERRFHTLEAKLSAAIATLRRAQATLPDLRADCRSKFLFIESLSKVL